MEPRKAIQCCGSARYAVRCKRMVVVPDSVMYAFCYQHEHQRFDLEELCRS